MTVTCAPIIADAQPVDRSIGQGGWTHRMLAHEDAGDQTKALTKCLMLLDGTTAHWDIAGRLCKDNRT